MSKKIFLNLKLQQGDKKITERYPMIIEEFPHCRQKIYENGDFDIFSINEEYTIKISMFGSYYASIQYVNNITVFEIEILDTIQIPEERYKECLNLILNKINK